MTTITEQIETKFAESSKIPFNEKMKVLQLERTCEMFPDQYKGKLEDGRMFYLRLRYQHITVDVSIFPTDDIDDALQGIQIICQELNQDTVNRSEIKELFKKHGLEVDWKGCEYIDPYRLPYNYNYSLLGMIRHQIHCRTFGLKLKWASLKRSLNYQSQLALRKRTFTNHFGKRWSTDMYSLLPFDLIH